MNEVLFHIHQIGVTPWKLIGYLGVLLFTSRWFVQMFYSRRHGRPVVPTVFWMMSISGSLPPANCAGCTCRARSGGCRLPAA